MVQREPAVRSDRELSCPAARCRLPWDIAPGQRAGVQGWFMQSGVSRFNFRPFSQVSYLIHQSMGAWCPGACLVNCIVQSCALCFARRGRGGGMDVLYIHLQEISCWSGRVGCKDLHFPTPVRFSSLYVIMVLVTLKPAVSTFQKIYASFPVRQFSLF